MERGSDKGELQAFMRAKSSVDVKLPMGKSILKKGSQPGEEPAWSRCRRSGFFREGRGEGRY